MQRAAVVEIVVDHCEVRSSVPRTLESLVASLSIRRLTVGDYDVGGGTLIERKTTRDLHLSIIDGRFWEQIGALRRVSRCPVLLVEGRRIDDGPLRATSIRGVLLAVADLRVMIVRAEGPSDSALWLRQLAARRSGLAGTRDRPVYSQRPKAHRNPREAALAAIPGVSTESARALLRHFGSVNRVAEATVLELAAVRGVGATRARAIHDTLCG